MKALVIFSAGLLLPAFVFAQQSMQQSSASRQGTHIDSTGAGRTSTATWHYHRGPKRAGGKTETSPAGTENRKQEAIDKRDSIGK